MECPNWVELRSWNTHIKYLMVWMVFAFFIVPMNDKKGKNDQEEIYYPLSSSLRLLFTYVKPGLVASLATRVGATTAPISPFLAFKKRKYIWVSQDDIFDKMKKQWMWQ